MVKATDIINLFESATGDVEKTKKELEKGLKSWVHDYIKARVANVPMAKQIKSNIDKKIKALGLDAETVYFYYGDPDKPGFKMPEGLPENIRLRKIFGFYEQLETYKKKKCKK